MNFNPRLLAAAFVILGIQRLAFADGFEAVLDWSAEEVSWNLIGGSFLKDGKLLNETEINSSFRPPPGWEFKAFLFWSGEVKKLDDSARRVVLKSGARTLTVHAQKVWSERSTGIIYTAAGDVTDILKNAKGPFLMSGLRSDAVDYSAGDSFSQAGWALLTAARKGSSGKRKLKVMAGAEPVAPGEPFQVSLWNGPQSAALLRLGVAGGHGIEGNGGGTLINGKSVSGGDDWRGSAGELWDVHVYGLSKMAPQTSWTLAFDPLLEWIFPSCAVGEFLLY